jgi:hypothetical protein
MGCALSKIRSVIWPQQEPLEPKLGSNGKLLYPFINPNGDVEWKESFEAYAETYMISHWPK